MSPDCNTDCGGAAVPAGQAEHSAEPSLATQPTLHKEHARAPEALTAVPAAHGAHVPAWLVFANVPGTQSAQRAEPSAAAEPGTHGSQEVAPLLFAADPDGQRLHAAEREPSLGCAEPGSHGAQRKPADPAEHAGPTRLPICPSAPLPNPKPPLTRTLKSSSSTRGEDASPPSIRTRPPAPAARVHG